MQILFELTAAQCEMVQRAGLSPRTVPIRNMRVNVGVEAVWAKCPVISRRPASETIVLPDGQVLTRLAKGDVR